MLLRIGIAMLLLSFMVGCSSSQPAPKPVTWESSVSPDEARQKLKEAEAKEPCSEQNMVNASEEKRRYCDPTRGMFDNIRPAQPATSPAKTHKRQAGNSPTK